MVLSVINTNNVTKTKNTKKVDSGWTSWSHRIILHCTIVFPFKKFNTIKAFEIWREKNPTVRSILGSNKLATMRRAIMKNKYISEMEIDGIKLEEQSKCEN